MDKSKTLHVVQSLANEVDPVSSEVFAPDSPYQNVEIIRALFYAAKIIESVKDIPENSGNPWIDAEEDYLALALKNGKSIKETRRQTSTYSRSYRIKAKEIGAFEGLKCERHLYHSPLTTSIITTHHRLQICDSSIVDAVGGCIEKIPASFNAHRLINRRERVTLDYLVDEEALPTFDKKTVRRIKSIQKLDEENQSHVFAMLDAFLLKCSIQHNLATPN